MDPRSPLRAPNGNAEPRGSGRNKTKRPVNAETEQHDDEPRCSPSVKRSRNTANNPPKKKREVIAKVDCTKVNGEEGVGNYTKELEACVSNCTSIFC